MLYVWLIDDIAVPAEQLNSFNATSLPTFIGYAAIVACLWLIVVPERSTREADVAALNWRLLALFCGLMLVYSYAISWIGMVLPSMVFLWIGSLALGADKKIQAGIISVVVTLLVWAILRFGLGLHLPLLGD